MDLVLPRRVINKHWCITQLVLDEQGLIVCCQLIENPNNLVGITRTAEVFGATELIFENLEVLNDKNYTS